MSEPTMPLPTVDDLIKVGSLAEALKQFFWEPPEARAERARAWEAARSRAGCEAFDFYFFEHCGLAIDSQHWPHFDEPLLLLEIDVARRCAAFAAALSGPPPKDSPLGYLYRGCRPSMPAEILIACRNAALRFGAILKPLRMGQVVAHGHTRNGNTEPIQHPIWSHRDYFLNKRTGDVFKLDRDRVAAGAIDMDPIWSGVVLEAASDAKPAAALGAHAGATNSSKDVAGETRRGVKPHKRNRVRDTMIRDVVEGRLTVDQLAAMFEKNMASQYGASRDTCRKARGEALSELQSRQMATNDK